jgi:Spy/CpxP family protein refolding chaperone
MKWRTLLTAALLVTGSLAGSAADAVFAQEVEELPEDPLFATLFPPELIMQYRRAIGLNDEQRDAISRLIQELQGRVVRLQWELLDEIEQLTEITGGERVDLDRALDQMDRVLDREKQIKQAHLEMLVRIKNLLTPEQQATLAELRSGGALEES